MFIQTWNWHQSSHLSLGNGSIWQENAFPKMLGYVFFQPVCSLTFCTVLKGATTRPQGRGNSWANCTSVIGQVETRQLDSCYREHISQAKWLYSLVKEPWAHQCRCITQPESRITIFHIWIHQIFDIYETNTNMRLYDKSLINVPSKVFCIQSLTGIIPLPKQIVMASVNYFHHLLFFHTVQG